MSELRQFVYKTVDNRKTGKYIKTFDTSAILNILGRAECFSRGLQEIAQTVRIVRNDCAHFIETVWTDFKFHSSFEQLKKLAESANLSGDVLVEIEHWKENGSSFILNCDVAKEFLEDFSKKLEQVQNELMEHDDENTEKVKASIESAQSFLSQKLDEMNRKLDEINQKSVHIITKSTEKI